MSPGGRVRSDKRLPLLVVPIPSVSVGSRAGLERTRRGWRTAALCTVVLAHALEDDVNSSEFSVFLRSTATALTTCHTWQRIVGPLLQRSGRCAPWGRDSLRPSPPTPRGSPVRADLGIRAPLHVPADSPRRERRPCSRPCGVVPRSAVLLRARGLSRPSASFPDPRARLARIRRATLAQVPRSPPALASTTPFLGTRPHPIRLVFVAPRVTELAVHQRC